MLIKCRKAERAPLAAGGKRLRRRVTLVLLMLLGLSTAAIAQRSDLVFEKIKHSLPQREISWHLTETDEPYKQRNGLIQASFVWSSGEEEVRATVVSHRSVKAVEKQFRRSPKGEPSMDSFRVSDLGDEAYLFPPIVLNQDGPFNLWFREAQYEISMSADSKATLERCAKYIVEAISSPWEQMPTEAAGSRR